MNGKKDMKEKSILEVTEEEKQALEVYKGLGYRGINLFLSTYLENDIDYANLFKTKEELELNIKKDLEDNIKIAEKIYSLMIKNIKKEQLSKNKLLRGTSKSELENMFNQKQITKFLSTTTNQNTMKNFAYDTLSLAFIEFETNDNIPFIKVKQILGYERAGEDEIIISPFVNITSVEQVGTHNANLRNKDVKIPKYKITIEKQNLAEISEEEKQNLKMQIDEQIHDISNGLFEVAKNRKIYADLQVTKEIYQQSIENIQAKRNKIKDDLDDLDWYKEKIPILEEQMKEIQVKEKSFNEKINNWKEKIIYYTKAQFKEIDKDIENNINEQEKQEKKNITNNYLNNLGNKYKNIVNNINEQKKKEFQMNKIAEFLQINYNSIDLSNIKEPIDKLKNNLEKLTNIDREIQNTNQIMEYNQYLNSLNIFVEKNLKGVFEAINSQSEENLKRAIYEKIENIKYKGNKKILQKQENELEYKNNNVIKRFLNKLTGKSKQYELKKDSIENMKMILEERNKNNEIRNQKLSIHNMLADIEIFLHDNYDTKEVANEVDDLIHLKEGLRRVYNVNEKRVNEIIANRLKENLPIQDKKITYSQQINMEENRFLKHNGYLESDDKRKINQVQYNPNELAQKLSMINKYIEINIKDNKFARQVDLDSTLDMHR